MSMFSFKSSHRSCSVEKGIFENVANFTGKHLRWSPEVPQLN